MTDVGSPLAAPAARRGAIERLDSETFVADVLRLTRPQLRVGGIERPELVRRIDRLADRPLLLVVAPTGSGKTVGLVQWTESDPRPTAWLTLDELDNDPVYLTRHLALALDQVHALPDSVFEPLSRAVPPLMSIVLPRLGREISTWSVPFLLVLDDVHHVRSPSALRCLQGVLAHLPAGSTLVASGRSALALPLSRLRVAGQLRELGPNDLAMQATEARELFHAAGIALRDDELAQLLETTEGWPAGLALAVMARQRGGAPTADGAAIDGLRFDGDHRLVAEYVRNEILSVLPEASVRFLLQSAVLPKLSGPLCDEVLSTTGSATRLEALASSELLFVVPLDEQRQWYRLHHLVAQALRSELHATDPALERVLHLRASAVEERDGNPDGAIRHALAAQDVDRAAELILANALQYGMRGRNATVGLWLDLVDEDQIATRAGLALARAWHDVGTGAAASSEHWADLAQAAARELPPERRRELEVLIAIYRAVVCVEGVGHMSKYTAVVRGAGPVGNPWWATATMLEGVALVMMSQIDRGTELLEEAAASAGDLPATQAVAVAQLAHLALRRDDAATATRLSDRALGLVTRHGLDDYTPIVPVYGIAALVTASAREPERARRLAQHGRRLLGSLGHLAPRAQLQSCVLLAQVDLLLGDPDAARTMVAEATQVADREPLASLIRADLDEVRHALDATTTTDRTLPIGPSTITTAELRVLELMPTHLSLGEIAEQLYVSRNTVKSHAISTYRKLGVSSRSGAVTTARELGLIEG